VRPWKMSRRQFKQDSCPTAVSVQVKTLWIPERRQGRWRRGIAARPRAHMLINSHHDEIRVFSSRLARPADWPERTSIEIPPARPAPLSFPLAVKRLERFSRICPVVRASDRQSQTRTSSIGPGKGNWWVAHPQVTRLLAEEEEVAPAFLLKSPKNLPGSGGRSLRCRSAHAIDRRVFPSHQGRDRTATTTVSDANALAAKLQLDRTKCLSAPRTGELPVLSA